MHHVTYAPTKSEAATSNSYEYRDIVGNFCWWADGPSAEFSMGPNWAEGLGAAYAPSGVQGQRPGRGSQGGKAPRPENDSSIAGSLYLSSPWHVCSYFQHVVHSKFTLKNQTTLWPNIFSTKLQKKFENMFWQSPKLLPTGSSFTSRQLNFNKGRSSLTRKYTAFMATIIASSSLARAFSTAAFISFRCLGAWVALVWSTLLICLVRVEVLKFWVPRVMALESFASIQTWQNILLSLLSNFSHLCSWSQCSWNFLISDDPSLTSVSVMSTSGGSGISDGFSGSADSESADAGASWVNSGPCCNMEVIFLWFVSITRSFFLGGIVRYGEKPVIFRRIKIESNFTPKRK